MGSSNTVEAVVFLLICITYNYPNFSYTLCTLYIISGLNPRPLNAYRGYGAAQPKAIVQAYPRRVLPPLKTHNYGVNIFHITSTPQETQGLLMPDYMRQQGWAVSQPGIHLPGEQSGLAPGRTDFLAFNLIDVYATVVPSTTSSNNIKQQQTLT